MHSVRLGRALAPALLVALIASAGCGDADHYCVAASCGTDLDSRSCAVGSVTLVCTQGATPQVLGGPCDLQVQVAHAAGDGSSCAWTEAVYCCGNAPSSRDAAARG